MPRARSSAKKEVATTLRTAQPAPRARPRRRAARRLPAVVYAQASPLSGGGVSLFEPAVPVTREVVSSYVSDPQVLREAVVRLRGAGFRVLQVSPITINIAGAPEAYEQTFGTRLVTEDRPVIKALGREDTATFVDAPDSPIPGLIETSGTPLADVLEGVAIEEPRYFHQSPFPPPVDYWHLRVPGDVSLGLLADRAHRSGVTGRGIRVVMTDSGWYRHPYFAERGYRSAPVVLGPGATGAAADEIGHGTAESANLFAVAPDVEFTMVKMNFVNTVGAFNAAVALGPHVISNSWGSSRQFPPLSAADQALAAAIALAVADGIIVVFSAGNGHYGFPGQHPDVVSAGGVFLGPDGALRASDYASGFASNVYPGRNVPDVCGLVGMLPRGIYIMLPLQAGSDIDEALAGGGFPDADQTGPRDGWAVISGTSAAAPQLAGASALVKQACPALGPVEVRDLLKSTATDVTAGTGNPATGGNPAQPGPDLATGSGLVHAHRAVLVARVRCLGPDGPETRPGYAAPEAQAPPRPPAPRLSAEDVAELEAMIGEPGRDAHL